MLYEVITVGALMGSGTVGEDDISVMGGIGGIFYDHFNSGNWDADRNNFV